LATILGGQTKILGGAKVIKSDKCMCDSQLLGARAWAAPYAPISTKFINFPLFSQKLYNSFIFSFNLCFSLNLRFCFPLFWPWCFTGTGRLCF